jgi:hypothetical protein
VFGEPWGRKKTSEKLALRRYVINSQDGELMMGD